MSDPRDKHRHFDRAFYETDGYEGYADWHQEIARDNIITPLFKHIAPKKNWKFLDVGCGMGGTILTLKEMGFEAQGTEVSEHCLQESPAKEWMTFGETWALPFPDASFDVVICCDVFQYLTKEQARKSIGELCRVSRGYVSLWVFDPAAPSWSQQENPDPIRLEDTKAISNEEYAKLFGEHGFLSKAMEVDFTEDSGVPEWHLLFERTS